MKRLKKLKEDGVPRRPGRVKLEVDRVLYVVERVVEPDLPPVAKLGVGTKQYGRDHNDAKQPVLAPRPGEK
jgi:hypothetical protein